jgi:hypothetical protein
MAHPLSGISVAAANGRHLRLYPAPAGIHLHPSPATRVGTYPATDRHEYGQPTLGILVAERRWTMGDTTVKKVHAASSPRGQIGRTFLTAGGIRLSMRPWDPEPAERAKHRRDEAAAPKRGTSP